MTKNAFLKNMQESGFTLIEVLIATVILAVGILTLSSMQMVSIKGNATSSRLTTASAIGADYYERLLNEAYQDNTLDAEPDNNPHDESEFGGMPLPLWVTGVNWTVAEWTSGDGIDNDGDGETDEGDETGIKLVTLSVSYNDLAVAKTMTVNFYKTELY